MAIDGVAAARRARRPGQDLRGRDWRARARAGSRAMRPHHARGSRTSGGGEPRERRRRRPIAVGEGAKASVLDRVARLAAAPSAPSRPVVDDPGGCRRRRRNLAREPHAGAAGRGRRSPRRRRRTQTSRTVRRCRLARSRSRAVDAGRPPSRRSRSRAGRRGAPGCSCARAACDSISKHSGALMSSRLMPPKVGSRRATDVARRRSGSDLRRSRCRTRRSRRSCLNRTALPSMTGLAASGPMVPRPSTAVPLRDHCARRFARRGHLRGRRRARIGNDGVRQAAATPGE